MHTAHLQQWLAALRSDLYQQGRNYLHRASSDFRTDSYCCLGLGCHVAGIPSATTGTDSVEYEGLGDSNDDLVVGYLTSSRSLPSGWGSFETIDSSLACIDQQPVEFNQWLGLPEGTITLNVTVAELRPRDMGHITPDNSLIPLFELNDGGFSFTQIADLIERFGLTVITPVAFD